MCLPGVSDSRASPMHSGDATFLSFYSVNRRFVSCEANRVTCENRSVQEVLYIFVITSDGDDMCLVVFADVGGSDSLSDKRRSIGKSDSDKLEVGLLRFVSVNILFFFNVRDNVLYLFVSADNTDCVAGEEPSVSTGDRYSQVTASDINDGHTVV